ncbi:MAG: dihydrofolate reductase [uncultured archaeon A07HR60]|jgi:Dihydrofolate reductase|nr:MAG: dihydrofolate reductase [uncultured archaeon A07HR60]
MTDATESPEIAMIAAVAQNGVIGNNGDIPWYYPADLDHFKQVTTGHPVIMGRRTYDGIVDGLGGPLPDRTSVVLSRSALSLPAGAVHADGVETAVETAATDAAARDVDTIYVAGGESVYELFLGQADRLVLTEVHQEYEGDTRFPAFDQGDWTETTREDHEEFSFVTYERRRE